MTPISWFNMYVDQPGIVYLKDEKEPFPPNCSGKKKQVEGKKLVPADSFSEVPFDTCPTLRVLQPPRGCRDCPRGKSSLSLPQKPRPLLIGQAIVSFIFLISITAKWQALHFICKSAYTHTCSFFFSASTYRRFWSTPFVGLTTQHYNGGKRIRLSLRSLTGCLCKLSVGLARPSVRYGLIRFTATASVIILSLNTCSWIRFQLYLGWTRQLS